MLDVLEEATAAGLLRDDPEQAGRYEFAHALVREALIDELGTLRHVRLHRQIGEALEALSTRKSGAPVEALAFHFGQAAADGDATKALHWLVASARRAERSYAFEAALEAYERVLFLWDEADDPSSAAELDRPALLLAAADAAGLAGRVERAADLAHAGLEEACAIDPARGVSAAGHVYGLLWAADRASELHEFATRTLLPVLDALTRLRVWSSL